MSGDVEREEAERALDALGGPIYWPERDPEAVRGEKPFRIMRLQYGKREPLQERYSTIYQAERIAFALAREMHGTARLTPPVGEAAAEEEAALDALAGTVYSVEPGKVDPTGTWYVVEWRGGRKRYTDTNLDFGSRIAALEYARARAAKSGGTVKE